MKTHTKLTLWPRVLPGNLTVSYPLKNSHKLHTFLRVSYFHMIPHIPCQDPEDSTSYYLR